jgi:hypothetical protein
VLHVTGDQASGGSSEAVAVQVGKPQRAPGEGKAGRSQDEGAPSGGPVDGGGSGGAGGGEQGGAASPPAGPQQSVPADEPAPARREAPRREHERAADAPLVGRALGAVAPAATQRSATGAAAARAGSDGGPALGWLAGAAGCLLLLGLGANAEWRAGARRRARVLGAPR